MSDAIKSKANDRREHWEKRASEGLIILRGFAVVTQGRESLI